MDIDNELSRIDASGSRDSVNEASIRLWRK